MAVTALLPKTSKIWIYQSNRALSEQEVKEITNKVTSYTTKWVSHSQQLKAIGQVLHNRFVILGVDQSMASASGCSIDSSVHFIQQLEKDYGLDFFDRMNFTYEHNGEIKSAHKEEFTELYRLGIINEDTFVFNNLVNTIQELETNWRVRLGDSWHMNLIE